jgi:hypothetical protein
MRAKNSAARSSRSFPTDVRAVERLAFRGRGAGAAGEQQLVLADGQADCAGIRGWRAQQDSNLRPPGS